MNKYGGQENFGAILKYQYNGRGGVRNGDPLPQSNRGLAERRKLPPR